MVSSCPVREGLCPGNSLPHRAELLTGLILHKSGPFSHSFCEYMCARTCHARDVCKDMLWLEMCAKVCHAWKYVWEHIMTRKVCKDVPWLKMCTRTCCDWRYVQGRAMTGDVRTCRDWGYMQGRAVTREDFHSSRLLPPALPVSQLLLRMIPQSCRED